MKPSKLPYFDYLLEELQREDSNLAKSFGRHVHWGYWENPESAQLTPDNFARAAEELTRQLTQCAALENNMAVLDVGCGFGGTVAHLNENYQNMRLTGLNLDERQLERARRKVLPVAGNTVEFKQGDACDLPFSDQSFDAVLAVECIFHFPSREQFLKEAFRVLKPGGCLALSDFVPRPLIRPFTRLKLLEPLNTGFYGRCDFHCGEAGYLKLAAETGFEVTVNRNINVHTLPTYSYLRRLSAQYRPPNAFALIETATAELLSRAGLLQYYLFSFQKP